MEEKNNLDNTSSVFGRLSLGPSEAKDFTGTINELIKVDPHEKELLYDPFEFFDDMTGQTLDKRMAVRNAVLREHEGLRQGAQVDGRT